MENSRENANIRNIVQFYIGRNKTRQSIMKRAKLTDHQVSRFLNKRGGLDPFALTRLLIAMELKLVDKTGKVVLGEPNDLDSQINDNLLIPIQTEKIINDNDWI